MRFESSSSSDIENSPPPSYRAHKSKVHGGIHGASRRRRARSTGGPNHPRYAVESAKNKSSRQLVSIELGRSSDDLSDLSDNESAISMASIALPRYLARPEFRGIAKEKIASVAPELADTALHYIRDGLECLGPEMLQVLAGVKAEPTSNILPKEFEVAVNNLSSDMPTHMLAVYSRHVPATTKRRVTLFPIHNIILATHCANLPILPTSDVVADTLGSTLSLPVVPLCIPAPEVFSQLSTFLYTKRIDHLLASLLPCAVPHALYLGDPTSERVLGLLEGFAHALATGYTAEALVAHALTVNGLWRNACALGIDDEKLWCALDVAWEVLITALAISTGEPL